MHRVAFAVVTILGILITLPAWAQNEIVITQAKALAGNVTPGDTAGYPITLSQPGAYILGSNLAVPLNQIGIYANSNNVDIDLNGFRINGGNAAYHGVVSLHGESRIHGGVINQFKLMGIYIRNNAWVIENMQIVRNGGMGIDATGARYISVKNSLIAANNGIGVRVGNSATLQENTISNNALYGIDCRINCKAVENTIENNSGFGIVAASGLVIGNMIVGNGGYGFVDEERGDVGFANNILIDNGANGTAQRAGGIDLHPNSCVGVRC